MTAEKKDRRAEYRAYHARKKAELEELERTDPVKAEEIREKRRAYARTYYAKNSARLLARDKRKRDANAERTREKQRAYREKNRERLRAQARERYQRKKEDERRAKEAAASPFSFTSFRDLNI